MGCDGGTIPKRDELVRMKKKPEQMDKDAENAAKWKHCAISQQPLSVPIVSCELGKLYNKDAVIENLLDKSKTAAAHIRNLKDVVTLNLTDNPAYRKNAAKKGDEYVDHQKAPFICPVVSLEMNGAYKFCYLRGCGCVLSERAFKFVKSENCHKCAKPFNEDDVVTLNGTEDEVALLRERMEERRQKAKLEKKAKKHKIEVAEETPGTSESSDVAAKKAKPSSVTLPLNGVKPTQTASESIAKDKTKSEAFKSLFTSHQSCKNKPKAHWITYNPLYN